ncbi:hypothetical protein BD311DRAFT_650219 [Dichomitus squalens]|uniref:Pentatricopeptide repeat domain-containing protein n=1 Tax=Dichomitus squalens TaxID=114155 RepID=A0A4Q9N3Z8_9APHY|nr:hypothetical protein BD311DRAFT_650219 [Dichomitus squalens]
MRHHAPLTTILPSLSLASVFQAAAGRAWAKTRPTRVYNRVNLRTEGSASSNLRTAHGGRDSGREPGEPSSSITSTHCAASSSRTGAHLRVRPSLHTPPVLPTASLPENTVSYTADNRAHAGDGFLPSPASRTPGVTSVDVDSSPPSDSGASSCASTGCLTCESDPPWDATQGSVPEQELPRATPRHIPTYNERGGLPLPVTPDDLHQNLLCAITSGARPRLQMLLEYHAAFPTLHSTASFNILIRYAIRHASFGTVSDLLRRMVHEGVAGNEETRALRVRGLVRSGRWSQAWNEELEQMQQGGQGIPLLVWLEFFGSVKRGAIMDSTYARARKEAVRLQTPAPSVTAGRLNALLDHPPLLAAADDWGRVPPRVVHAIVRAFLLTQPRRPAAMEITERYFQTLPHELDDGWRRACLAIIHLHLTLGRARKLSDHFAALRTLFALLDMHHDFHPTSATLFFLLQTLRYAKDCGSRADRLVRSFERRWGPDIIDHKVRRRWASLLLKQGNVERAQAVLEAHDSLGGDRASLMAEEESNQEKSNGDLESALRWLDLHRTQRQAKERWLGRLVRRRLWREQVRRSG